MQLKMLNARNSEIELCPIFAQFYLYIYIYGIYMCVLSVLTFTWHITLHCYLEVLFHFNFIF